MARVHDLLGKIADAGLREALAAEVKKLEKGKKFGLVFEEHLPEAAPMPGVPIRGGMTVATRAQDGGALYFVKEVVGKVAKCVDEATGIDVEFALDDIVTVTKFGEPIYPYLQKVDEIEHGGGDLWHTLIQADNYHALQLLEYLYAGKVDCIYIDPPYNTGAKDWKYNNDYVDGNDAWRHSKWLSMMEKRLKIAKRLLNPKDSVLIVTIDEKEYLHLGMLLEHMFPEARIEMVTCTISAKGVVRAGQFSRVEEYIFVVYLGCMAVVNQAMNMLDDEVKKEIDRPIEWLGFRRRAPQAKRASRPNQFYPVFVNCQSGVIDSIGDALPHGVDRRSVSVPDGCVALWPLSRDGDERLWSLIDSVARRNLAKGYLRVQNWNPERHSGTVYYLTEGTIAAIENGMAKVCGYNADGSINAVYVEEGTTPAKRVWKLRSHNAESYGTNLIQGLIGSRFSYPKSLYVVHDTIRFFVANKPNALILDFFAGSGTTLHAVNLLNAEDGGKRRCILVTNNEVSADEAVDFAARGIRPGDDEWEKRGVAQYVTWPRTKASISGRDVNGNSLEGRYGVETEDWQACDGVSIVSESTGMQLRKKVYSKERRPLYPEMANIPMADGFQANAAFFKLGFLEPTPVGLGRRFAELLPLLWMKAGAIGKCPTVSGRSAIAPYHVWVENRMAVLFDESAFAAFRKEVKAAKTIETIYVVTDFDPSYRAMARAFPGKAVYPLYRDYLDTFRVNASRS